MYWKSVHFKLWCIFSTAFLARKAKKYYDSTHLALSSCERNATGWWEGGEQVLTLIHSLWEYQNICNKSSCMAHSIHWVSWHLCDKEMFALPFLNWHWRSLSWFFFLNFLFLILLCIFSSCCLGEFLLHLWKIVGQSTIVFLLLGIFTVIRLWNWNIGIFFKVNNIGLNWLFSFCLFVSLVVVFFQKKKVLHKRVKAGW